MQGWLQGYEGFDVGFSRAVAGPCRVCRVKAPTPVYLYIGVY